MDYKSIKGVKHYVYELTEVPSFIEYKSNWREGVLGDWVLTDDSCVVQILFRGTIKTITGKKVEYIRTVCGSYVCNDKTKLISDIPDNIYTFSGKGENERFKYKKDVTGREILFARYIVKGDDSVDAYLKSYPTNNEKYAEMKSKKLLKTKRIQNMIDEEIKKALDKEGVSPSYLIRAAKTVIENCSKDSDRMRGIEFLSKVSRLLDNDNKKQELTIFQGFSNEQIEQIKKGTIGEGSTKVIAHAEK